MMTMFERLMSRLGYSLTEDLVLVGRNAEYAFDKLAVVEPELEEAKDRLSVVCAELATAQNQLNVCNGDELAAFRERSHRMVAEHG